MNILDKFSLQGKTGVVTGGSGLCGRCIVEDLGEVKAKVIIASRNLRKGKETASLGNQKGYEIHPYSLDLSSLLVSLQNHLWQMVNIILIRPLTLRERGECG